MNYKPRTMNCKAKKQTHSNPIQCSSSFQLENRSWKLRPHFGTVLDNFGVLLEQFGVILDNLGVVLDKVGSTKTPKNRIFDSIPSISLNNLNNLLCGGGGADVSGMCSHGGAFAFIAQQVGQGCEQVGSRLDG